MDEMFRLARTGRGIRGLALAGMLVGACGGSAAPARAERGYSYASTPTTASAGAEAEAPSTPMPSVTEEPAGGRETTTGAAGAAPSSAARTLAGIVTTPRPTDSTPTSNEAPQNEARPMIIYVADVTMTVERVTETADRAIEMVVQAGGFLASRNDQTVQVRVPAARFRELLAQLEHLGEVTHQQIAAEDVSEQFHDLEIQLTNLRAMRVRMEEFLHRASNVSEALMVEHELERIASQIDQIEGRMRFLSARAAFSTITLNLVRREVVVVSPQPQNDNQPALPFSWLDTIGLPRLTQLR